MSGGLREGIAPRPVPVRDLLECGLRPAVGCTEPVAIALATAHAARAALGPAHPDPGAIDRIEIRARLGVYKNALAVPIPNAGGRRGLAPAAALGALCDPDEGLHLLGSITPDDLERAVRLEASGVIHGDLIDDPESEHLVQATVRAREHVGMALLAGRHDRLARLERDGNPLPVPETKPEDTVALGTRVTLADLWGAADGAAEEDLERVEEGIRLARAMMRAGLKMTEPSIATALRAIPSSGAIECAAAAAVDARMNGVSLPVMTSCGSGNQGIMVHLPIALLAEREGIPRERTLRAVALAHLITRYASDRIGLLAPLCGAFAKAGLGAAGGVCYLLGGDAEAVDRAVRLMIEAHTGTLCDGAKPGCAAKIAAASEGALRAGRLGLDGFPIGDGSGLAGTSAETAIDHVATIAASMKAADRVLFERLREEAEGTASS